MTSYLELYKSDDWVRVKRSEPGKKSSFTDYGNGLQTLYVFECSIDNTKTSISRLVDSGHTLLTREKVFVPMSAGWEHVVDLLNDEEYRLSITTREGRLVDVRVVQREF